MMKMKGVFIWVAKLLIMQDCESRAEYKYSRSFHIAFLLMYVVSLVKGEAVKEAQYFELYIFETRKAFVGYTRTSLGSDPLQS